MKLYGTRLLERLCMTVGVTGFEQEVAEMIKEQIGDCCDELIECFPGNMIAHIKGESEQRLMISAHMDEVGFMISEIHDDGFLYFQPVGGIDPKILPGKRVIIKNEKGSFCGVISSKSIHLKTMDERKKVPPVSEMYIDIGADSAKDAEKYISVGDVGTFDSKFVRFGNGLIKARAIDDRGGCTVMCDTIRYLRENNITPYYDLYFAFTCREECGNSGARTAANLIKPSYALVLECTAVADIYGTPNHKRAAELGGGAVISMMDNSTVYLPEMVEYTVSLGEKNGVKCQRKKYVSGGTDSGHIHKSNGGVKCINMSIPSRYIHSPSCVIDERDLESVTEMAKLIVTGRINQ